MKKQNLAVLDWGKLHSTKAHDTTVGGSKSPERSCMFPRELGTIPMDGNTSGRTCIITKETNSSVCLQKQYAPRIWDLIAQVLLRGVEGSKVIISKVRYSRSGRGKSLFWDR